MSSLAFIGYAMSVMLNAVLIVTLIKQRRASKTPTHTHTWTPWSDFIRVSAPKYSYNAPVYFRRVRYCADCSREEQQKVGYHQCAQVSDGKACGHQALYTAIFDPMYELRQINKDLEELQ